MKRDLRVYVEDIPESAARIEEYTKTMTKDEFLRNTQVQDAVVRRLEIMGEAVKNIPEEFRAEYPQIPWKKIAGTRDVLAHEYFGVKLDRIWKIAKEDIPDLKSKMLKMKEDLAKDAPQGTC